MKKVKEKFDLLLNNKILLFVIIMIFGSVITCFSLVPSYNVDGYCQLSNSYYSYAKTFFAGGRFFTALIWVIFHLIHMPRSLLSILSVILSNIFLVMSVLTIYSRVKLSNNDNLKRVVLLLGSLLLIYNPFLLEYFVYEESFAMCFSVFCTVKAASLLENKNKKSYLISTLWLISANFFYQGSLCLYLPLVVLFSAFDSKKENLNEYLKHNFSYLIIAGLCYAFAQVFGFVAIRVSNKLFNSNSLKVGNLDIKYNLIYIGKLMQIVWTWSYNFIDSNLFHSIIFLLLFIEIVMFISHPKEDYTKIIQVIFIALISFLLVFVPNVVMRSDMNYTAARLAISFGGIIGLLIILSLLFADKHKELNKYYLMLILSIGIFFFIMNSINYLVSSKHGLTRYRNDVYYVNTLMSEINEYKEQNDIEIDEIYIRRSVYYYGFYFPTGGDEYRYKLTASNWAFVCGMEGITKETYEVLDMDDEEYQELFVDDLEHVNEKGYQMVFDNNKVYILLY